MTKDSRVELFLGLYPFIPWGLLLVGPLASSGKLFIEFYCMPDFAGGLGISAWGWFLTVLSSHPTPDCKLLI